MKSIKTASVCGLGKLGACIAVTLAARGFEAVEMDDIDREKIKKIALATRVPAIAAGRQRRPEITRARQLLHWAPKITLEEGLSRPSPTSTTCRRNSRETEKTRMEVHPVSPAAYLRIERGDVIGVNVSAITMDDATATIERWIREGRREYVCITGVHGVMECRRDPLLREIHNQAGMVTPDGVPLVYFLRLIGRKRAQRVYGPDLMREM